MITPRAIKNKISIIAKLLIFGDISKEYFKVVDAEDAAVADSAALA